jgi:hypothetical protein
MSAHSKNLKNRNPNPNLNFLVFSFQRRIIDLSPDVFCLFNNIFYNERTATDEKIDFVPFMLEFFPM